MRRIPSSTSALLCALTFILIGCGGGKEQGPEAEQRSQPAQQQSTAQPQPAQQPATQQPAAQSASVTIKAADRRVMEITVSANDVTIELGADGDGRLLVGRMHGGLRRYELQGNVAVAEVKAGDDAFKVRTPDGKLLWKVKLKEEKIKISDNEENQRAYSLKLDGEEVKIKDEENELGKAKFYTDRETVKVKNAAGAELFESGTTVRSTMYGVLLMERIPETERAIIMAELLARGR